MNSLNKVIILGFLSNTPTKNDKEVTFTVATNETFTDKQGEKITRTDWHKILAYGKTAETCFLMLRKGSKVLVEGKIRNILPNGYQIFACDVTFISQYNKIT